MERGVEQVDPRASGQRREVETRHGLRYDVSLSQAEVPHCSNRSKISLSRSVISRSFPMNSSSCRTSSTSAVSRPRRACYTDPRPRATLREAGPLARTVVSSSSCTHDSALS